LILVKATGGRPWPSCILACPGNDNDGAQGKAPGRHRCSSRVRSHPPVGGLAPFHHRSHAVVALLIFEAAVQVPRYVAPAKSTRTRATLSIAMSLTARELAPPLPPLVQILSGPPVSRQKEMERGWANQAFPLRKSLPSFTPGCPNRLAERLVGKPGLANLPSHAISPTSRSNAFQEVRMARKEFERDTCQREVIGPATGQQTT
jgi:hypothetical protein